MHAQVWFVLDEDVTSDALLARYGALLSAAEHEREQRFVFEADRRRHRVTRALVRTVLSEAVPTVAPADWSFVVGSHGRPELHPDHGLPPLSFNVSHCDGAVVLAVKRGSTVGIDVESRVRKGATVEIAERFFSPAEVMGLHALLPGEQRDRFFVLWTLKEAYIKARGLGLSIPLESFSFELEGDAIALRCEAECEEANPARWAFAMYALTPSHTMSMAVEGDAGESARLPLELVRTIPLVSETPVSVRPVLASPRRAFPQ